MTKKRLAVGLLTAAVGLAFVASCGQEPRVVEVTEPDPVGSDDVKQHDRFWEIIEGTTPEGGAGTDDHVEAIAERLGTLTPDEIVAFQASLEHQQSMTYRWDLWGVAYIALGGCSDDSFDYFRNWLIAQGRTYLERALKDPSRAVDALKPGNDAEFESLDYVAARAYEELAGKEFPYDDLPVIATEDDGPAGDPWSEDDVYDLFPGITRRFGSQR